MDTVRRQDDTRISPASAFIPTTAGSPVMATLQLALAPGERLVACAKSTRLVGKDRLERDYVALTDQRILILAADDAGGVRLAAADARSACWIINHRELANGSLLMILGRDEGYRRLYFEAAWRAEALTILEAVRDHQASAAAPLMAGPYDVDRFQIGQEFAGILQGLDDD